MLDLRVDSPDEQETVERMAKGAAGFLERRTGFVLIPGRFEALIDDLPWPGCPLEIMRGPLRELESISYRSSANGFTDLEVDDFPLQQKKRSFVIARPHDFTCPSDRYCVAGLPSTRVRFLAGFDTEEVDTAVTGEEHPLDDGMRTCFIALVAHFYQNRELFAADKAAEVEAGAGSLLNAYRQFW
jgi:uncharacterized phiE125 gp8 family phage protein